MTMTQEFRGILYKSSSMPNTYASAIDNPVIYSSLQDNLAILYQTFLNV